MGFTPPTVPSFSVGTPLALEAAQAAQEAPVKAAQLKTDEQTAKAQGEQAQLVRQQASDQLLQRIVAPAVSNPALADSPQWQKMVFERLAATGAQIPKNAQGKVDVQALQGIVSPVVKPNIDAQGAVVLQNLPPEARKALASLYNPASITPELMNSPMVPDQRMKDAFFNDLSKQYDLVLGGKSTPSQYLQFLKERQGLLPYVGMSYDAMNHDESVISALGETVKANIERLKGLGLLDTKKAALAEADVSKSRSVTELNEAQAAFLGTEAHHYTALDNKIIADIADQRKRTDAYVADLGVRMDTARNGSPIQWARVQGEARRDAITQLNQANVNVRAMQAIIAKDRQNIPKVNPDIKDPVTGMSPVDNLQEAIRQRDALQASLNTINSAQFNATSMQGALNAVGSGQSFVHRAAQPFDATKANRSKYTPTRWQMPDGTIYDTSSGKPVQVQQ